jgi:hypothetical protein
MNHGENSNLVGGNFVDDTIRTLNNLADIGILIFSFQ